MKTVKSVAVVWMSLVSAAVASAAAPQYPRTDNEVIHSLNEQVLGKEQVADLFDASAKSAQPMTDLELFSQVRTAPAPSSEGIPTGNENVADLVLNAYSAPDLVAKALQDRKALPVGERIRYLEEQAGRIIRVSGDRSTEVLLRLTLNRAVDVLHHVLPMAGENSAEIARYLANFMKENFEYAAAFANNKVGVESRIGGKGEVAGFLSKLSIAEFGRIYSSLVWRYSQELTSDSAKAVILMRLVGYLGWDLNTDLRRRERPIAQTIADIYVLQHSPIYQRLIDTMGAGQEPKPQDLAQFRRQVYSILQNLPQRLKDAGVEKVSHNKALGDL